MPDPSAVVSADEWGELMPRTVGLVDGIAVLVGTMIILAGVPLFYLWKLGNRGV
jgi:hypothetical protein